MDDILLCQVKQSFKNISDDWLCSLLSQILSLSQFRLQITLVTYLCDYVAISIASKYLKASEDIGVI